MDSINIPITATIGGLRSNLDRAYNEVERFATTSNNLVGDMPIRLRTQVLRDDIKAAQRSIREMSVTANPIEIPLSVRRVGPSMVAPFKRMKADLEDTLSNTIGRIQWDIPIETRVEQLGQSIQNLDIKSQVAGAFSALDEATAGIEAYIFDVPIGVKLQQIDQATESFDTFLFDTNFEEKIAKASDSVKAARLQVEEFTDRVTKPIKNFDVPIGANVDQLKQQIPNIPKIVNDAIDNSKTGALVKIRLDEAGFFDRVAMFQDDVANSIGSTTTLARNLGVSGVNKALSATGEAIEGANFYAEYLDPRLMIPEETRGLFFNRVKETIVSPFNAARGPLSKSVDEIGTTIKFRFGQMDDFLSQALIKVPAFIDDPDKGLYPILQPMLQSVDEFASQIEKRRLKPFNVGSFFDQNVSQKVPGVLKSIRDGIRSESELIGKDIAKIKGFLSDALDTYNQSYTGMAINDTFATLGNSTGINFSESSGAFKKQLEQIPASIKKITDKSEALPLIRLRLEETGIFDQLKKGANNANGTLTSIFGTTAQKIRSLQEYLDPELFFDDNTRGVFFSRLHQVFISPIEAMESPIKSSVSKVGQAIATGIKGTDKFIAKGLIKIPDLIDNPDKGLYPILQPMLQDIIRFSEEVKRIRTTPFDRKTFFDETIPNTATAWMNKISGAIEKGRVVVDRQARLLTVSFKKVSRDYNRSYTGQSINDAVFQFGSNTGMIEGYQNSASAIKSLYADVTDYIISRTAIVGKAQKGMESQATFQFYKAILSDIGDLMVKAFTPGSSIRKTTASAALAGAAFTGVSKSVKGVYSNTALVGNSLGKLVKNVFDFKNNLEGAVTATVFLFQKISASFWVQQLTPLGDIQQYLVTGLIPNLGTIMQMMGILNKYSAGPLLMQARYANVVKQLAIAEKVITSMTLRSGQAVSSFKGLGLVMKSFVVPAKMQVALTDMVMTLQMFNMQLQAAIMGSLMLGDSIVASAEGLLGGQGFLMPGVLPLGPTAGTMFQIDQGIETAVNYDQMTKQLQTVTGAAGATKEEIDALRRDVLKMGGDTTLTFQQITDGITEMAVGAYSVDDIRENFIALSEAAQATGVELRDVVGSVQSVATAYNLDSLGETGQVLARISAMTGTPIIEISKAMVDLKGVSLATKTEFGDLASFVSTLTDKTGRFSTESVQTIQSVYSQLEKISSGKKKSDKNLTILERLGISRSDFEIGPGMLKPIDDIMMTFRQKIAKATEDDPNAHNLVAQWLSGNGVTNSNNVMRSLNVLGVGADVDELKDSLSEVRNELGSASEFIKQKAEEQNNSFTGQLQRLVNATFAVSASVGRMFQPFFQIWIDGALNIANWFNKLGDNLQKFGISLQVLIPVMIVYFKFWILHKRVIDMVGLSYKVMTALATQQGRAEFFKNLITDAKGLGTKLREVGDTIRGLFSGRVSGKEALQDTFNFIGKTGKANMEEFIGTTKFATSQLLAPVDALGRWAGGLTRVNVSMKPVIESLASMSKKMLEIGKAGAEFALWQGVGVAGDVKKRVTGIDVGRENMKNAYKMAMGYGADTMPTIDGKTVYESMNFAQNMALLAVQIGLVTAAWYTLTELFKRSEGAKIAEDTKKLNKELQETYKTTGLISKDKSFTEIGKGIFSSVGDGFGKIQEFYGQIDILTPLESQLGKFEKSLMNTKKKDFTPKVAPIEQTITAKQAGKAVLDLFVNSRKGPTTKPVDPTNLQLGSITINKASTQDFTNKLNLLIVKSFVIQKSNAIQKWATGLKDEVAIGLVRGAKATVGFIKEMQDFVSGGGDSIDDFREKVVVGAIDAVKNLYEGLNTYIERIKAVGFIEATRESLSSDPKSSFGTDASVSGFDVANGLGMVAGSMTGLLIAASVLGIALNPLGLVIAGLASAFIGLSGVLKGAWKTAEQAGNIQSMLAKDELLKTTDLSLESSQNFLNQYGIANRSDLAKAKDTLTPEQKAEIESGTKSQIENLQSAINTLEKTKSASPEEKAITESRIKLYQDEVNRLRHREGVIKGTIAINEKLVYSYKELNDEIAQMNYSRELTNSFNNAKYEKRLVEDPDKLINREKIIAKERAKMRENEIRGNIQALAEEKRKLTERTGIAPKNDEEAKEYEAAKKRLAEIDIEYNKNVTDLAKSQQDEMKRLSQERVDNEIAKFNKLNAVLKQQTTQKEIGNEFAFGVGAMDKDQYSDNQSKIKLDTLFSEKKLLEDELKAFMELNRNKDFSNKDLAQKKIDLEQKISDTTLQIIQERNSKELDLTLRNIRIIAAEKARALQNEARNKEFDENDLNRRSEASSATSDVEKLSMDRGQKQLEYQLQIAELMNDETKAIQLREQLYASQLNMKLAEIAAQKELLALQSEAKMVSAERTAIESELAVIESESALAEAIANNETNDVLTRLEDELAYKQRLVENSYQNISSAEQLASLEQQKLQLTEENEVATLNEARSVEQLREQTESVSKAIEDVNKQLKEQQDVYKRIESAKKLANQEKLLSLAGTGGFDIASTLMDNELAVSSLGNEISLLQGKLEQLNGLTASAGNNKEISGAILETEKELADKVLEQQLTILGQQIEFKKQLTSEVQLQLKAMEEHIAIMERMSELEMARNQEVKARLDYYSALLDIQKQISGKVLPTLETGDIDSLLDGLKAQENLQKRIDRQRIETLRVEHRIALSGLDIEERKSAMSAQRQRAELRNNVLLARDAVLQADQSGDDGAIAVTRQQLDIANQALSNFEHQESLNQQINRSKRATLETENKSLMVQEKANQKAESFAREQEKINAISRNITNEIDKQQKKMQSIADLNKAISDYRINALEKESSRIDDIIGMRKELGNKDSEMPDTLRKELTLQMESMKKGSSTQSEKSLYAEKLNIEQRLAKERYQALLAEQAMEKSMFEMETRKLGLEMRTAEMQAKIIAMQAKGTELEGPANDLVRQAEQGTIDFERERSLAKEALRMKQAMDKENLEYDNASKINETRRTIAEAGYTPEGKPAVFKPSDFIVPTLVVMDESLKQVDKSILKFEEVGTALDTFTSSLEGLSQRIDQINAGQSQSATQPSTTTQNSSNTSGPGGPGGPGNSGTVINVASVSVISSDPTGDARKVLTDLAKANKNK